MARSEQNARRPLIRSLIFVLSLLALPPLVCCVGCRKATTTTEQAGPSRSVMTGKYHKELLTYAIDNLNRLEEFESPDATRDIFERLNSPTPPKTSDGGKDDPILAAWPQPEMLRQIVDRLNQWVRTQPPPADWQLDPMLAALPEPLAELPQVKGLGDMEFTRFDGYALQQTVWLRDIGLWARGDSLVDLERASNLFDWTVRNIEIEPDDPQRIPLFPWETLLFGRGTAEDRAWVFVLLARQLGLDAALLAVEENEKSGDREEKGEPQEKPSGGAASFWCVAVLIDGKAYLFDPKLGLPIPGRDGVAVSKSGELAIRPATLDEVASDEELLRQLDADEKHPYGVTAAEAKKAVVLLEASPLYLARRMKLLENNLAGPQKMVLSASPTRQAESWKSIGQAGEVRLWLHPFEALQRRSSLDWKQTQLRLAAMLPFYAIPTAPLYRGRVLQLKGKLVGEEGATHYYQIARPSNQDLAAISAHPAEVMLFIRCKQDASYWSGLIAYERGNYASAIDYFTTRTLLFKPPGPWINGARYNLARTFEASGQTDRAVLAYHDNADSPGYAGDLLRAKWLKEKR